MFFKVCKNIIIFSCLISGTYSMLTAMMTFNNVIGFKVIEYVFLFFAGLFTDILAFITMGLKEKKD